MEIRLLRSVALGNGTRKPGFVLGELEGEPRTLLELTPAELAKNTKAAEGVTDEELKNAFLNRAELLEVGPPVQSVVDDSAIREVFDPETESDDSEESSDGDWTAISVSEIGLDSRIAKVLSGAGIETAGQLAEFGDKNQGFKSLNGIGQATEEEIITALSLVVPDSE